MKELSMKKTVAALTALALGAVATVALADPGERQGRMLERLKAADTNADGLISRAEAAALPRLAERFDAIDANKDGQVSFDELRAARAKHGHGGHFKRVDTDGDGKVSRAEALAAAEAAFARADANGDGFVTPEEMKAAHKSHRGGKQ
jgi:Ca2+-binding EF-hand superfamily protein